jgi:hypothetical protein
MPSRQIPQLLLPMKRSVVHDYRYAFGNRFDKLVFEPILKKFSSRILCIAKRLDDFNLSIIRLELRRRDVCSFKFPPPFYALDFYATDSPTVFPDKATLNSALVNVNALVKRKFLYPFEIFRPVPFGFF